MHGIFRHVKKSVAIGLVQRAHCAAQQRRLAQQRHGLLPLVSQLRAAVSAGSGNANGPHAADVISSARQAGQGMYQGMYCGTGYAPAARAQLGTGGSHHIGRAAAAAMPIGALPNAPDPRESSTITQFGRQRCLSPEVIAILS